jgi:hypothetical protein
VLEHCDGHEPGLQLADDCRVAQDRHTVDHAVVSNKLGRISAKNPGFL